MSGSVTCYCGAPMRLVKSVYGRFYACTQYPHCDGKVGAHQDTGEPLGRPADKPTREARVAAHAAFDPLWHGKSSPFRGRRKRANQWLRQALGISEGECHVAMFDAAMCRRVIEVCTAFEVERVERSA